MSRWSCSIRRAIAAVSGGCIAKSYEGRCVGVGCKLVMIVASAVKLVSRELLNLGFRILLHLKTIYQSHEGRT